MRLNSLRLENFRCHDQLELQFDPGVTLLSGGNGAGKTAVIEALGLVSSGQSFRADRSDEMISFDSELARVQVRVSEVVGSDDGEAGEVGADEVKSNQQEAVQADEEQLEVILTRGLVQGARAPRKQFRRNGVPKRARDVIAQLRCVVFRPEDLRLIEGSPSRRRWWLDQVLSPLFPEYAHALTTYDRTLIRRNRLLQAVQKREQPPTVLQYWNMSLLKHGELLQTKRRWCLEQCAKTIFPVKFHIEYLPRVLTPERLEEYSDREQAAGHTLIGPHKDDWQVFADVEDLARSDTAQFHDVAAYGSRGQQRLAVLWLKTCETRLIETAAQVSPVLLLDDIMSELDDISRSWVEQMMKSHQTVVTTAATETSPHGLKTKRVKLEKGVPTN